MSEKTRTKAGGGAKPFAKMEAEFGRLLADFKLPAQPDLDKMMEMYRRNVEALSAATRVAWEGAQAVTRRQMETLQETIEEVNRAVASAAGQQSPRACLARQAELVKEAHKHAVAHMKEVAELIGKSNTEALDLLNQRFAALLDEIKAIMEKAGG